MPAAARRSAARERFVRAPAQAKMNRPNVLIPYAQADKSTGIWAVKLSGLIDRLIDRGIS